MWKKDISIKLEKADEKEDTTNEVNESSEDEIPNDESILVNV